ncbi:SDR family oxidoreductase [bacterium]|nr:SDR family oxidoreductase [bacterium]
MEDLFSVKGKVVLITGGSRGIGLMMAKGFVKAGARVYISSRNAAKCQEVSAELSAVGTCMSIPADLSSEEGVKNLAVEFGLRETKLDVLINNSGAAWGAPLVSFPQKGWDKILSLNLVSIFNLTKELLPQLEQAGSTESPSRIINIGSIAAISTNSMEAYSYGTSKAAVHQLTRMLAKELAPKHITVNAIAPGRFPSKMTEYVMADKKTYDAEVESIPLKRWGQPDDIAGLSIFLASHAGAFLTGNIIPLDGGTLIA